MEPLVERERELDAVARVVRERGVLVIEGGAGLGKTSLLQAACRQAAARGDRVVRAGGSELESGFAFGVVRQLFERAVAEAGPDALAGPAQAAAALLGGGDEPPGTAASDTFFAVVHGLYQTRGTSQNAHSAPPAANTAIRRTRDERRPRRVRTSRPAARASQSAV